MRNPILRSLSALSAAAIALFAAAPAFAQSLPAPDALTENAASLWGAQAQNASATVANDFARVRVGSSSLRFDTDGGFDTWLWSPQGRNASWDFRSTGGLAFWVYAENANFAFQNHSPWIRLHTTQGDYYEFSPSYDVLNEAIGEWIELVVPLGGNELWTRTAVGAPSLALIRWIEIHADTWGAGFSLWFDGMRFDVPRQGPSGLRAFAGNAQVALSWREYDDPTGTLSGYAVYRSTSPFASVSGMTPLDILPTTVTSYTDATAANGVRYHYAVTARFAGGGETTEVASLGPRTPRDETDLQVVSIARTPRFPRYAPTYTVHQVTEPSGFGPYIFTAATGLGSGQTGGEQRWPEPGQVMTYTATIRNRGTNPIAQSVQCLWRVDGQVVQQGFPFLSLSPGQTVTFTLQRPWDGQSHDIEFSLQLADARPANNTLAIDTKSVPFLSYIDRTRDEEFREETPAYPQAYSDDFIDWLNNHMAEFNRLFEEAGSAKRVHFDILAILGDEEPTPPIDLQPFAIFPLRYRAGEGSLRTAGYYRPAVDIDYGLLHEMGHQLGLIDLYRLNVDPNQNQVNATGYSAIPCLMNGVSDFLSRHSADAMNHWLNAAHGYYGQYLYRTPDATRLRLLDANGQPLAGASVTIYQKCERPGQGEVITSQIKAQGTTDAQGHWTIPNIPINPALAPVTHAGDELRPNPFGYIAVVGTNAVFLIKAEHNGFVDWAWLALTELNDAYSAGQTQTATFERRLALGGAVQTIPPADMAELNAADWGAWAQGGSASIHDDQARLTTGQGSVRFETDGGFDTSATYPGGSILARWDLSSAQHLKFWAYAENPNIGFQGGSPWIRLADANGFIELHPTHDILNDARNQWLEITVPLAGDAVWQRSITGTPDIAAINRLEIHADTWGAGFTLWLDGVRFDPPPIPPCYANCDGSTAAPILNVNDFVCFQQRFAAGDPYANCDGSTAAPVLNINDFVCFQQRFAAGCP